MSDRNISAQSEASAHRWRVLKFGGTSVRDADRIRSVAEIVEQAQTRSDRVAVVVSALGGATDQLLELAAASERLPTVKAIVDRHRAVAAELGDQAASASIEALANELEALAQELPAASSAVSEEQTALLLSFGERFSAPLVASALRQRGVAAEACDTRPLITTSARFLDARVDNQLSLPALEEHFNQTRTIQVATGFVGSDKSGRTTTLGRGGSDLTAAVLGAAVNAEEIEIWTDVDGVLDADPRVVAEAKSIPRLSYEEVMELAHFGAKVLYPPTVTPARDRKIPLRILNTLNPQFEGTVIGHRDAPTARPFTGITSVDPVALLTLVGSGMLGVTGTAHRFFGALARVDCNAILISQASSEHTICAAIPPDRAEQARHAVDLEFERERRNRAVRPADIESDLSVVAVVGEGMRDRPGIAAKVFGVLGANGINVRAIAQGSSELNISVAVQHEDRASAVRALHRSLFRSGPPPQEDGDRNHVTEPLEVMVAGVGGVGAEVLTLLSQDERFRLAGVVASRHQWLAHHRHDNSSSSPHEALENPPRGSDAWRQWLATAEPNDPEALVAWLEQRRGQQVFVDCTASTNVAALYPRIAATGTAMVAANKIGMTFDASDQRSLSWNGSQTGPQERIEYEATVGAGLPVISTLRSLIDSGDEVFEISGVFSGTLGFLLAQLRGGSRPSQAIRAAFDAGYTEPDPRDDLSGTDVARKLLILARTCGVQADLADVAVEPLVPFDPTTSLDDFWSWLPGADHALEQRLSRAADAGETLAYLARLQLRPGTDPDNDTQASPRLAVGLTQLPHDHPACQLEGTDNLFSFRTARYDLQPLVVRGPGAGTAVTAAGIFSDLLAVYRSRDRTRDRTPDRTSHQTAQRNRESARQRATKAASNGE